MARDKRSHRSENRERQPWMSDVKARDHDSSSSDEEMDQHVRWLAEAVEDMSNEERCEMFAGIGGLSAVVYAGCGVIFIVTGSLGVAAARTMVGHRQSGLVGVIMKTNQDITTSVIFKNNRLTIG